MWVKKMLKRDEITGELVHVNMIRKCITLPEIAEIYAKERGISKTAARKEWLCVEETINKLIIHKKVKFKIGDLAIERKKNNKKIDYLKFSKDKEVYNKPYRFTAHLEKDKTKAIMEYIKKNEEKEKTDNE